MRGKVMGYQSTEEIGGRTTRVGQKAHVLCVDTTASSSSSSASSSPATSPSSASSTMRLRPPFYDHESDNHMANLNMNMNMSMCAPVPLPLLTSHDASSSGMLMSGSMMDPWSTLFSLPPHLVSFEGVPLPVLEQWEHNQQQLLQKIQQAKLAHMTSS
eukprot:TRINITY_DN14414_c0_g1_i5.p2 TRINITY_DN14414_c0_g1~~TRINITY_DN14414_c0_g1_i5.p2  ORF type:complete len:158 (-),score=45.98 TRINITY_DN14414_c0_g1_i5:117-590(-)